MIPSNNKLVKKIKNKCTQFILCLDEMTVVRYLTHNSVQTVISIILWGLPTVDRNGLIMHPDTRGTPNTSSSKKSSTVVRNGHSTWLCHTTTRYTSSHSPHYCDMLRSPTNHFTLVNKQFVFNTSLFQNLQILVFNGVTRTTEEWVRDF